MNKVYCRIISRKLLYEYQGYSRYKKRHFKRKYLYPILRRIGNDKFWAVHNEVKNSANRYLIDCNSMLTKRTLKKIRRE